MTQQINRWRDTLSTWALIWSNFSESYGFVLFILGWFLVVLAFAIVLAVSIWG